MRLGRHATIAITAVVLAAVPFGGAGCKAKKAIEAVWPVASVERVVPRPPAPPRWPLTGLQAASADETKVRVVSVKIENSPPARPQSGLDQADVVYETITEGGVTRFNALFHSKAPGTAGPVRSARWSDTYIVPQYQALFAHCGGKTDLLKALRDKRYSDMDQFFNPAPYVRASDRSAPHNLYMDVAKLRADATAKRGYSATAQLRGFPFDRSGKVATPTITVVTVPFNPDNKVTWSYDQAGKVYLRAINGKAHSDRTSGRQYSARNVVVLWALVKPRSQKDVKGTPVVDIVLTGSGRASIFRDGQRIEGRWETQGDAPPAFKAEDGSTIKLSPGVTWFQVVETGQEITTQ
jgi:hypothetical protein